MGWKGNCKRLNWSWKTDERIWQTFGEDRTVVGSDWQNTGCWQNTGLRVKKSVLNIVILSAVLILGLQSWIDPKRFFCSSCERKMQQKFQNVTVM